MTASPATAIPSIRLPSPSRKTLPPLPAALLESLRQWSATDRGVIDLPRHALARLFGVSPDSFREILAPLVETRRVILALTGEIAVVTMVSNALHAERVANRRRLAKGRPQQWPYRLRIAALFPDTANIPRSLRPASYTLPSTFGPLLARYSHCHFKARPADVEIFAGPYYPGELESLLTSIAEQESAAREIWLLYTRKSVHLAIRRRPHR